MSKKSTKTSSTKADRNAKSAEWRKARAARMAHELGEVSDNYSSTIDFVAAEVQRIMDANEIPARLRPAFIGAVRRALKASNGGSKKIKDANFWTREDGNTLFTGNTVGVAVRAKDKVTGKWIVTECDALFAKWTKNGRAAKAMLSQAIPSCGIEVGDMKVGRVVEVNGARKGNE